VSVFFDREGNTLTVWFDEPAKEQICEETGEEVVLIKDRSGRVIGFEKVNFLPPELAGERLRVAFETGSR
jgi:hypothetical protein